MNVSNLQTKLLETQQSFSDLKSVQINSGPAYDSEASCGTDLYCTEHHVLSFSHTLSAMTAAFDPDRELSAALDTSSSFRM